MHRLTLTTVLLSAVGRSLAQNATTPSATDCVDPSGMASCLSNANSKLSTCINEAGGNDNIIIACGWGKDVDEMVCYQQSCWNKAYSCEYQYLVSSYKAQRTVDEKIPFYPAPNNAPGGCSCNLGQVATNATASVNQVQSCGQYTTSLSNDLLTCQCCAWSAAVSAFYGLCPDTSPDGLGFSAFASQAASFETISGSCAGLTAQVCLKYGIGSADNGTYLDPAHLPTPGTAALSTTSGPGALTTPPAGPTITWEALSQTFTVTAAAYNKQNVGGGSASSTTSASGGSGGSTGSASGTPTGAAASTTSKPGAASRVSGVSAWGMALLMSVVAGLMV